MRHFATAGSSPARSSASPCSARLWELLVRAARRRAVHPAAAVDDRRRAAPTTRASTSRPRWSRPVTPSSVWRSRSSSPSCVGRRAGRVTVPRAGGPTAADADPGRAVGRLLHVDRRLARPRRSAGGVPGRPRVVPAFMFATVAGLRSADPAARELLRLGRRRPLGGAVAAAPALGAAGILATARYVVGAGARRGVLRRGRQPADEGLGAIGRRAATARTGRCCGRRCSRRCCSASSACADLAARAGRAAMARVTAPVATRGEPEPPCVVTLSTARTVRTGTADPHLARPVAAAALPRRARRSAAVSATMTTTPRRRAATRRPSSRRAAASPPRATPARRRHDRRRRRRPTDRPRQRRSSPAPPFPEDRCAANEAAGTITYLTGFDFAAAASMIDVFVADAARLLRRRSASTSSCSRASRRPTTRSSPSGDAQFASGGSFSEVVNFAAANDADLVAVAVEGRSADRRR